MANSFSVETFRTTKETRDDIKRRGGGKTAWASAWVVRFRKEGTRQCVEGGGSSRRVAAMRAAEFAVAEGWF